MINGEEACGSYSWEATAAVICKELGLFTDRDSVVYTRGVRQSQHDYYHYGENHYYRHCYGWENSLKDCDDRASSDCYKPARVDCGGGQAEVSGFQVIKDGNEATLHSVGLNGKPAWFVCQQNVTNNL